MQKTCQFEVNEKSSEMLLVILNKIIWSADAFVLWLPKKTKKTCSSLYGEMTKHRYRIE